MPATQQHLRNRTSSTFALAASALLGLAVGGCAYVGWHEGGDMQSNDKHVYVSTSWQPKTVTLLDTRSGEKVASWDIPVGKKLAMQFYDGKNQDDPMYPTLLRYEIMPASQEGGTLHNSMPAPDRYSRRLDWELRPVPEYPPEEPAREKAPPPPPNTQG
jgi:hypothetical protein